MSRAVVVIGGGISGLTAAWELTGGLAGPNASSPHVILMESSDRVGGALRSGLFGGRNIDIGPDGFLGRRPEAYDLCHEVGLGDALVPIGRHGAGVWARGRVRRLPGGLALGVPTRFWPTFRSGVLDGRGVAGLARDAFLPRPDVRRPIGDRSVGPLVARKLGQGVVDQLVDPMIGGIHAGSVDDMSAAASYPVLLAAAQRRGSLMRALRAETPPPAPDAPPLFWTIDGGLQRLADRLKDAVTERGADIRLNCPVERLDRTGSGWVVVAGDVTTEADAVVLAVPAPAAAGLLSPHDEEAATLLGSIEYASVALITFRLSVDQAPPALDGTGFLVPRRSPYPDDPAGWATTACTYLSYKWPHLALDGEIIIRASVGRFGDTRFEGWSDDEMVRRTWDELTALVGFSGSPTESLVVRFPDAFPQYRVHHLLRVAGIEAATARVGGLAVAGAAYRGVGIPACIASGRAAAHSLL
jgi:oxygen-dependent protoporphyrinogen oxidase